MQWDRVLFKFADPPRRVSDSYVGNVWNLEGVVLLRKVASLPLGSNAWLNRLEF